MVTLTNASADAKTYTNEADWKGVKVKILKRDNTPIVNSISAKMLESLVQQITSGFPFPAVKFADITVPGSGTAGGVKHVQVALVIPTRLALALQQSTDFDLCYDLIGDCSVTIPAPTDANLTLSNPAVTLIASGHRDHNGHVKLGNTLEFNEHSVTLANDDIVPLGNGRLLALQLVSGDKTTYPVAKFTGVQLKVDNGLPIVDLPNQSLLALSLANGDLLGSVPTDNARENVTHAVGLFTPRMDTKVSELPKGAAAQVHYTTIAAEIPNGKFLYGSVIVRDPPVSAALAVIPAFRAAWDKHGAKNLGTAGIAFRPTLDGKPSTTMDMAGSLPVHLRLPGIAVGK